MAKFEQGARPVSSFDITSTMELANQGRNYDTYTRKMDAAVEAKVLSIFSRFQTLFDGMVIVDAGSGTGLVAERIAQECHQFGFIPQVFAVDISHAYLELSSLHPSLGLLLGDVAEQLFVEDSVAIKYYSTSGHEVASFGGGVSRMVSAVKNSYKELLPGGQLLIRDFVKPENNGRVFMELPDTNGIHSDSSSSEEVEYQSLSTLALFKQFHQEFGGGEAFSFEEVTLQGKKLIAIDLEWAYEFYMRKEYTDNWGNEIHEKYAYWTVADAEKVFEDAGFENVSVESELNAYMLDNWLVGQIFLYQQNPDGELEALPFPATHMIVSGTKPL